MERIVGSITGPLASSLAELDLSFAGPLADPDVSLILGDSGIVRMAGSLAGSLADLDPSLFLGEGGETKRFSLFLDFADDADVGLWLERRAFPLTELSFGFILAKMGRTRGSLGSEEAAFCGRDGERAVGTSSELSLLG